MTLMSPKRKNIQMLEDSILVSTPSPSDFEQFMPWACSQSEIPANVYVSKIIKDDSKYYKKISAPKSRQTSNVSGTDESINFISQSIVTKILFNIQDSIPIVSIYNNKGDLLEIVIKNVSFLFQLLTIIGKCLQFHLNLYKLTLKGKGVNCAVIIKLCELIEYSNITDLCLDDTYVPEGNYSILIKLNNLKSLSLSRCSINESVCKNISENLLHSSTSLMSLNLSSNRLLDSGTGYIGYALRKNRSLLHLDISDNGITDAGIASLLKFFTEFPLTSEEILEYQIHKGKCLAEKYYSYTKCNRSSDEIKESLCEYKIMYDERKIINKNCQLFDVGNFKVCSLNIAYNNLTNTVLPKICYVLKYQKHILQNTINLTTGVRRIVLSGNNIANCIELDEINEYLKQSKNNFRRRSFKLNNS